MKFFNLIYLTALLAVFISISAKAEIQDELAAKILQENDPYLILGISEAAAANPWNLRHAFEEINSLLSTQESGKLSSSISEARVKVMEAFAYLDLTQANRLQNDEAEVSTLPLAINSKVLVLAKKSDPSRTSQVAESPTPRIQTLSLSFGQGGS